MAEKKIKKGRRVLRGMLIGVLVFAVVFGAFSFFASRETAVQAMAYENENSYIVPIGESLVSAHRSGGGIFPENTLLAFKSCVESDTFETDIFEFDLALTKDEVLILLHDSTLDRTSDAIEFFNETKVKPSQKTYQELRNLNMGENFKNVEGEYPYRGLRGENIPDDLRVVRLEDVLDYLEAHKSYSYIIEIKDGGKLGEKAADILYDILLDKNLLEKAIVGTFNGNVTKYMDSQYPDMLRSAGIAEVVGFYFAALFGLPFDASRYNFDALQIPPKAAMLNLSTTRFLNYAHKRDIAVQYWTVNDENLMRELNEKGADAIITDIPDVAYAVIHNETADLN